MRFIAGSSYDSVGSQELQRDSARDSRWFNSLQAQRALQDQVNNEAARRAQAEQQNYAQAIAQQQYSQQQRYNQQLLEADQGRQRQNFTLQTRQQNLLAERPDPRIMRFNEDQNADLLADQDTAETINNYMQLLEKRRQLQAVQGELTGLPEVYKKRVEELDTTIPKWMGGEGWRSEKTAENLATEELMGNFSQYIPNMPFAKKNLQERIDLASPVVKTELEQVNEAIKTLARDVQPYVREDADGNFVSTFRPRSVAVPVAPPVAPQAAPPMAAPPSAGTVLQPQPVARPLRFSGGMPTPGPASRNEIMAMAAQYGQTNAPTQLPSKPTVVKQNGHLYQIKPDGSATYIGPAGR